MVLEKKSSKSTIILPLDIIETILLLQPSKSLLRFKSVCKSWNNIISNYEFVKNHLQQSTMINSRNQIILARKLQIRGEDPEPLLFKIENSKFQIIQKYPNPGKELECSADGLVLLQTSNYRAYYLLLNPSTKQQSTIPCPPVRLDDDRRPSFGFCRGLTLDDYMIVAFGVFFKDYAVYSCKNKAWTEVREFPYNTISSKSRQEGVFVGGFSFWCMTKKIDIFHMKEEMEIVYFDPRYETFNTLQKPGEITEITAEEDVLYFYLTSLKGCLCLYYKKYVLEEQFRIWILRDNNVDDSSWSQLMIINKDNLDGFKQAYWITPLFFTEKNELVIRYYNTIGIYNSMEKKFDTFDAPQSMMFKHHCITV